MKPDHGKRIARHLQSLVLLIGSWPCAPARSIRDRSERILEILLVPGIAPRTLMILGTLHQSGRYETLSPKFAKAFAFLRAMDGSESLGRHDIDGDDVFALVQQVTTKPAGECQFEAHRQHIDIQCVLRGRETILWAPLDSMVDCTRAYDPAKDAAKWNLVPDRTPLHLAAGHFTILFPEDAHAPCVEWDQPEEVLKVVVKVRVEG